MAFEKKDIAFQFPVLGMDRRMGGAESSPGSTVDAVNVRPDDTVEGRLRGGSRPGIVKAFTEQLGGGSRIQHLGQLNTVTNGLSHAFDTFSDVSVASKWSGATAGTGQSYLDGYQKCTVNTLTRCAVGEYNNNGNKSAGELVLDKIEDLDVDEPYTIGMTVKTSAEGQKVWLFFELDDDISQMSTSDSVLGEYQDNCVYLFVNSILSGGDTNISQWDLEEYVGGSRTQIDQDFTAGISLSSTDEYAISIQVDGTSVTITIGGTALGGNPYTINSGRTGQRFGFVVQETGINGSGTVDGGVSRFTVDYKSLYNKNRLSRRLVAVANGQFYVENDYGEMELDTSDETLNTDEQLQGIEMLSKYYIADFGDEQTNGTGATISTNGLTMTVAGEDFANNYNIDANQHVVELYDKTGAVRAGIAPISTVGGSVGTTTITFAQQMTTDLSTGGTASYRIARGPKVYDPTQPAGSRMSHYYSTDIDAKGSPPFGCRLITRYSDRLCMAGDIYNAHLWYQCRQGDPTDWNYFPTANDVGRPVAGQSSEAGTIGEQIIAQMAHSDDYLIYGSFASIYVLRGDASYGGRLDNISRDIGMVSGDAWCYGPSGELVFLTKDGIYSNERGVAAPIQSVSREKLPRELLDIDTSQYHVSMVYDNQERGIHIMVSAFAATTASQHFFITWPYKFFVRSEYVAVGAVHDTFALFNYTGDTHESNGALMGCRDGYIRTHSFDTHTDDGWEVPSIVALGPVYLSEDETRDGILQTLSIDLDDNSADVRATVITGVNHKEAMDKAEAYIAEVLS